MKAIRLAATAAALVTTLAVAVPSHAADQSVAVAAFQFVQGGWVAPAPFIAGTAVEVTQTLPSFRKGDKIIWTNNDLVPHQVFRISGPSNFAALPQMGTIGGLPGATSSLSTGGLGLGKYVYGCSLHAGMRGAFVLTA
jgi:hypothetical protein